jgi:hypothetical protein
MRQTRRARRDVLAPWPTINATMRRGPYAGAPTAFRQRAPLVAALAADVQLSNTQDSFFNGRYCAGPAARRISGASDCEFNTWEQCIAGRAWLGPLVHHESVLARASTAAEDARQE